MSWHPKVPCPVTWTIFVPIVTEKCWHVLLREASVVLRLRYLCTQSSEACSGWSQKGRKLRRVPRGGD